MTWRGTAEALRALGYPRVETPAACAWNVQPPYYSALADRIAGALDRQSWVLVGHSGAGGLLPSIAAALRGRAARMVFVDAILPHPGKAWFETAPPALSQTLRDKLADDRVPPWPDWLPPPVLEALLPDASVRTAFAAGAKPIPAAYLAERAPLTPDPTARLCGYLQLSTAYQAEADAAAAAGWSVACKPLHHLAMITEPASVAAALHRLMETLSQSGSHSHER